jgi:hypothetical protein
MHDPMYPRIPSLGSVLTFGTMRDTDAAPTIHGDNEQFVQAMQQRGVRAIHNAQPEEPQL